MKKVKLFSLLLLSAILTVVTATKKTDENEAKAYVDKICLELSKMHYETTVKSWDFASNITDYNQKQKVDANQKMAKFSKTVAKTLLEYDFKNFKNATLKRLIGKLADNGDEMLEPEDYRELQNQITKMQNNYAKVKIPGFKDKSKLLELEPEITEIFETSTDPEELKYYWTQWYDLAGTPVKDEFFKYAELKNKAARLNGEL